MITYLWEASVVHEALELYSRYDAWAAARLALRNGNNEEETKESAESLRRAYWIRAWKCNELQGAWCEGVSDLQSVGYFCTINILKETGIFADVRLFVKQKMSSIRWVGGPFHQPAKAMDGCLSNNRKYEESTYPMSKRSPQYRNM